MVTTYKEIEKIKDKRVVLLNSGGLDSCFLACLLNRYNFEIHHIFVDYGQNALIKEKEFSRKIADSYQNNTYQEVIINLPWLKDSSLINGGEVGTFEDVKELALSAVSAGTYVPMRNHVLISIASSYAEHRGIKHIASALDGKQSLSGKPLGGTPDKHPRFVKKLEKSLTESSIIKHQQKGKIELITPILNWSKEDVISSGLFIGTDFSKSWTCYNGGEEPCGKCCACVDRQSHFDFLGLKDPFFEKV